MLVLLVFRSQNSFAVSLLGLAVVVVPAVVVSVSPCTPTMDAKIQTDAILPQERIIMTVNDQWLTFYMWDLGHTRTQRVLYA